MFEAALGIKESLSLCASWARYADMTLNCIDARLALE